MRSSLLRCALDHLLAQLGSCIVTGPMTGNVQRHYRVAKIIDAVHQQQQPRLELVMAVAGLVLVLKCARQPDQCRDSPDEARLR